MAGKDMAGEILLLAGEDKSGGRAHWKILLINIFHPPPTSISKLPIGIPTFLRRVYVENEFLVSEVTGTIIIWALYNIQSKGIVTECIEIEPSQVQHSFEWN